MCWVRELLCERREHFVPPGNPGKYEYYHPLEVVGRGSKTQLQVSESYLI